MLYLIDEKWRGVGSSHSLQDALKGRGVNLHTAWQKLGEENLFGKYAIDFTFDPLYGRTNLELALAQCAGNLIVRLGGCDFCFHLDLLDKEELREILNAYHIEPSLVETAARRLNTLLEEQVKRTSPVST